MEMLDNSKMEAGSPESEIAPSPSLPPPSLAADDKDTA